MRLFNRCRFRSLVLHFCHLPTLDSSGVEQAHLLEMNNVCNHLHPINHNYTDVIEFHFVLNGTELLVGGWFGLLTFSVCLEIWKA